MLSEKCDKRTERGRNVIFKIADLVFFAIAHYRFPQINGKYKNGVPY
jgi:hypothetical protein